MKWALPLLLLLPACAACPPVDERPVLAACVVGELPPAEGGVRRAQVQGRVQQIGVPPVEPCVDWLVGNTEAPPLDEALWLALGREREPAVRVGLWGPDLALPEQARRRDRWSLDVRVEDDGPDRFELRDADDLVVFWIGRAATVETLAHPVELIVEAGRAVCRQEAACGGLRGATLEVEIEGARAELRPHERLEAETGNWWDAREQTVVHGGHDVAAKESCADEASVTVAWWERPD